MMALDAAVVPEGTAQPRPATPRIEALQKSPVDSDAKRAKMAALTDVIADFEPYIIPGRYLILEGGGLSEQVALTAKPITLYLFNDAVATASKRTRLVLSSASKKLTLDRLWMLNEITITDLPDTKNVTNALKLSRRGEHVVLQAETATGKRLWLQHIVKTQRAPSGEEATAAATEEGTTAAAASLPGTPRTAATASPRSMARESPRPASPAVTPASRQHRRKISAMSRKEATQPADILPEKHAAMVALLDKLNAESDKCNYDAAVEAVDKIKYELAQMDPRAPGLHLLQRRLQTQVAKLATFLYHEIADLIIGKAEMSKHIQRLVVLGFPDEAREKFLAARSDFIRERTKHLRYTGDVAKTVNDIGFATFSSIASSADWYISSFKDHTMTAGFVFWVKLEINNYVNMIVKQVFTGGDIDFRLIGDCVAIARRQCGSLCKIGLDFVYYLDDQLLPHIKDVLQRYQTQCEARLKEAAEADDFMEDKVEAARKKTNFGGITTSAAAFYQMILAMLNDVEPLLLDAVAEVLIARLASFFENYSTYLLQCSYREGLLATAALNIFSNVSFMADEFLPTLARQLEARFNRTFADLAKLNARLTATVATMYSMFAKGQAHSLVPTDLSYGGNGFLNDDAILSPWLVDALPVYAKIGRDAEPVHKRRLMHGLLIAMLTILQKRTEEIKFGTRGIQQYLLDVHFLLLVSRPFLDTSGAQAGLRVCQAALTNYGRAGDEEELRTDQWYDDRAQQLLAHYPMDFGPLLEQ